MYRDPYCIVPWAYRPSPTKYLPTNIQTHLSTFPVNYLPTYLPIYLPIHLPTNTYILLLGLFLSYPTLSFLVLIEVCFGMSWSLFRSPLKSLLIRFGTHKSPFRCFHRSISVSSDTPNYLPLIGISDNFLSLTKRFVPPVCLMISIAWWRPVPKSETRGFDSWLTWSLRTECNFPLATSDVQMMAETKFYS